MLTIFCTYHKAKCGNARFRGALLIALALISISAAVHGQAGSNSPGNQMQDMTPELVPQTGPVDFSNSIFLSNDGALLATGSADRILLWNGVNGQQLRSFLPTASGLQYVGVALSPDGRTVIGLDRYHLDLFDALTGKLVRQIQIPVGPVGVQSMISSPDASSVLLSGDSGFGVDVKHSPFVMSLKDGSRLFALEGNYNYPSDALSFSPDGKQIADGNFEQFVRIHDARNGKLLAELTPDAGPIQSVAFSPDGRRLAVSANGGCHASDSSGNNDCTGRVLVFDLNTKKAIWESAVFPHSVGSVAFENVNQLLIVYGAKIQEFLIPAGTLARTIETHRPADAMTINYRLGLLATSGWATQLTDLNSGKPKWTKQSKTDVIASLDISSDNESFALGERDGDLLIFSPNDKDATPTVFHTKISTDWVRVLAINNRAGVIAVPDGTDDGKVKLLRLSDGVPVADLSTTLKVISSVAFSPDGSMLAVGGDSHDPKDTIPHPNPDDLLDPLGLYSKRVTIELLSVPAGGMVREFVTDGAVGRVAFTQVGSLIADIGFRSGIWEWQVADGAVVHSAVHNNFAAPNPYSAGVLAVSPDGRQLAQYDGAKVRVIDATTLKDRFAPLQGFEMSFLVCAFSPDGKLFAVGSDGISLFNAEDGTRVRAIKGLDYDIATLRFSADSKFLFSSGLDGPLRIWDTGTGKLLLTLLFPNDNNNGGDWLAITPEGLFDGTAAAMGAVGWRPKGTNNVVPLDAFFSDFFYPGVFQEIVAGRLPKPTVDIETALQVPGLRMMLAEKMAHTELHGKQVVVCFEEKPGAVINAGPLDQRVYFPPVNGYEPGTTSTCKFEKPLASASADPTELMSQIQTWKPVTTSTPWDGKPSTTSGSTLHVLTVGVSKYPDESGFGPVSFGAPSAKAIESFFRALPTGPSEVYKSVRIWDGLFDAVATREMLQQKISEMTKEVAADDVVLLYLAGHGEVPVGSEMFYFIPFDGRESDLPETAISTAALAQMLRGLPAARILVVVDTCQSGGVIEALGKIGAVKVQAELQRTTPKDQSGTPEQRGGVVLIAATLPLSYAVGLNNDDDSALARTILNALAQGTGILTANELSTYVRDRLPDTSADANQGFRQVPLTQSIGLDFPIVKR